MGDEDARLAAFVTGDVRQEIDFLKTQATIEAGIKYFWDNLGSVVEAHHTFFDKIFLIWCFLLGLVLRNKILPK